MKPAESASSRPDMASGSQLIHLLTIFLLSATGCATALAATSPMTACDRTADLQSLEVPVSELSASVVGHVSVEADEDDETLIVLPAHSDTAAPILNLAPRVAVILRDVFSAVAIETPPSDSDNPATSFPVESLTRDVSPLSPIAGDAGTSESSDLTDQDSAIKEADAVPGVQRQMFRTDI